MSQSVQERKILAETWMKAKQTTGQHVMVQVGGAPLPDVLELVKMGILYFKFYTLKTCRLNMQKVLA